MISKPAYSGKRVS